jgi:hypothetical protein
MKAGEGARCNLVFQVMYFIKIGHLLEKNSITLTYTLHESFCNELLSLSACPDVPKDNNLS